MKFLFGIVLNKKYILKLLEHLHQSSAALIKGEQYQRFHFQQQCSKKLYKNNGSNFIKNKVANFIRKFNF